ncbi:DUF2512 family protein [Cohnella pontilimi]|uniref:DUF2512 family protein n=1 Tax=Cohnella pontilimi TaxID=2564100 RepID=A0A4U0F8B5_9BACL|nr:DUF2512 family protein [Cohnella pontilimi]TJY40770.1 DUF2512 family protein [Cohnella pontilimi]
MLKFLAKWVLNASVVALLLYHYVAGITLLTALLVSTIFTVVAYFVGDQLILRASNNTVATLADAGLSILYLWMLRYFLGWDLSAGEILMISAILGLMEWIIHRYILKPDTFVIDPTK